MIKGADARINFLSRRFASEKRKRENSLFPYWEGKRQKSHEQHGKNNERFAEINAESKLVKIAQIFLSLVILAERYSYVQV